MLLFEQAKGLLVRVIIEASQAWRGHPASLTRDCRNKFQEQAREKAQGAFPSAFAGRGCQPLSLERL